MRPSLGCVRQVHAIVQSAFRAGCALARSVRRPRSAQAGASARKARKASLTAMQQWLVPSPDPDTAAHAVLFRPRRRRAVSAGRDRARLDAERAASRANAAARIPRAGGMAGGARLCRAGAGTSGPWRDGRTLSRRSGRLRRGRLFPSGRATADEIASALAYLRRQSFIRQDGMVVIGHSAGAWGALALASEESA